MASVTSTFLPSATTATPTTVHAFFAPGAPMDDFGLRGGPGDPQEAVLTSLPPLTPVAYTAAAYGEVDGGRHGAQTAAIVAAILAGTAVLLLVSIWVVKRRAGAVAKLPRGSLRTGMMPNRSLRYSVGSAGAVEQVERSRSSVSYGFGTFGEDGSSSPGSARWSTVTLDAESEDIVFEARPQLPPLQERPAAPLTEHAMNIELGALLVGSAPLVGIMLEQYAREGPVVVSKIVPGSPAWLVPDPSNRVAVGDVLLGVQAVRLGHHHDLANARALLASQIDVAFKSGRPIRLTVGRHPDA